MLCCNFYSAPPPRDWTVYKFPVPQDEYDFVIALALTAVLTPYSHRDSPSLLTQTNVHFCTHFYAHPPPAFTRHTRSLPHCPLAYPSHRFASAFSSTQFSLAHLLAPLRTRADRCPHTHAHLHAHAQANAPKIYNCSIRVTSYVF